MSKKFETDEINFQEAHEIERRRGVRMAELLSPSDSSVSRDESPFSARSMAGAQTIHTNMSGKTRLDIQNIGSGTRCISCGLLHFCWVPKCISCKSEMDYNKGV
jgi:hypothetical protein